MNEGNIRRRGSHRQTLGSITNVKKKEKEKIYRIGHSKGLNIRIISRNPCSTWWESWNHLGSRIGCSDATYCIMVVLLPHGHNQLELPERRRLASDSVCNENSTRRVSWFKLSSIFGLVRLRRARGHSSPSSSQNFTGWLQVKFVVFAFRWLKDTWVRSAFD